MEHDDIRSMNYISIETAQNVEIQFRKAGIGRRIAAHVIDTVLRFIILYLFYLIFQEAFTTSMLSNSGDYVSMMVAIIVIALCNILYTPLLETFMNGQTIGKRMVGIRVVKVDGTNASIGNFFVRWVIGVFEIGFCGGGIALIAILVSRSGQRLGDLAAGTVVVQVSAPETIDSLYIDAQEVTSITYPSVDRLSAKDVETIREVLAVTRRGRLDPSLAVDLLYSTKDKVASVLEVSVDVDPETFLTVVISDWMASKGRTGPQS